MNSRLQQKIEWSFPRAPRSLVISDLPIKEGTVLFLEQNLLWWRGSQGPVWNGHVWSIHHARNALRWVGCILVSQIRWTQRLSRSYSCLGYAPCKLPKATLILHTELWAPQQEQVEDFPSSIWWLLALSSTRELPWAEQGEPSQATLLLSDGQLGLNLSQILYSHLQSLVIFSFTNIYIFLGILNPFQHCPSAAMRGLPFQERDEEFNTCQ